jgi:sialic acid synthase
MDIFSFLREVLPKEKYEMKREMGEDFFVIAEIGNNHQGSFEICKELIKCAYESGVDAVKLQKRDINSLYTDDFLESEYNNPNSFGKTYREHRENLELSTADFAKLKEYAEGLGLVFFATVFDIQSADFINGLGCKCFKISSGDMTNVFLLDHVAKFGKPMIISTGAATISDIKCIYNKLYKLNSQIALLHCVAKYPCPLDDLNLNVIPNLVSAFPDAVIGISEHCPDYESALLGYILGARIFEKHFTLKRTMKGPDHHFSLEADEMKRMVYFLKKMPKILGNGIKEICAAEEKDVLKMRKKLVFSKDLEPGYKIQISDLDVKSPGNGISPMKAEEICGLTLKKRVKKGMPVKYEHFW